jgi:hypothetical protein
VAWWPRVLARLGKRQPNLSLYIQPTSITVRKGQRLRVEAFLQNRGSRPVTLILPGDGSRMGRRTPVIEWLFTPGGKIRGFEGCGVLNAFRADEVFTLQPDETRIISQWVAPVELPPVSQCRAFLVYTNDPGLPFMGALQRPHDRAAIAQLLASDKCSVASNEIDITIESQSDCP